MTSAESSPSPRYAWGLPAAIVLLAFALRVWGLGGLPDGLFRDEAARGYDAYSLLKTGRGAFGGSVMPILFQQHFGLAWVEGLYNYLTVPWVAIFGLTVFATRLTAALAGTATVFSTFLLARAWFGRSAALIAAALVAVSPWHLVFSRIAFRGILLPLAITLGCWLFVTGLERSRRLIACGAVFGLALHTYSVSRLAVPLAGLVLLGLYFRPLWALVRGDVSARRRLIAGAVLFVALAGPMYYLSVFGPANARFHLISVFNAERPIPTLLMNYAKHLSPVFLFFQGDPNPRHSLPAFGQILAALLPFVLMGIFVAGARLKREWLAPVLLFLTGCVPPALTTDGIPHALRAIGAFPFLEILAAGAIAWLVGHVRAQSRGGGTALATVIALLIVANAALFLAAYFGPYRALSRRCFDYGERQAIEYVESKIPGEARFAVMSNRIPLGYIFPLFFARLDPAPFQKDRKMGHWSVTDIARARARIPEGQALYIADPREVIEGARARKWIRDERGNGYLKVLE